jgi:hypothetical protein
MVGYVVENDSIRADYGILPDPTPNDACILPYPCSISDLNSTDRSNGLVHNGDQNILERMCAIRDIYVGCSNDSLPDYDLLSCVDVISSANAATTPDLKQAIRTPHHTPFCSKHGLVKKDNVISDLDAHLPGTIDPREDVYIVPKGAKPLPCEKTKHSYIE